MTGVRVPPPTDHRLAPFARLRSVMPLVDKDAEAGAERLLLHRMTLGEAVRK